MSVKPINYCMHTTPTNNGLNSSPKQNISFSKDLPYTVLCKLSPKTVPSGSPLATLAVNDFSKRPCDH